MWRGVCGTPKYLWYYSDCLSSWWSLKRGGLYLCIGWKMHYWGYQLRISLANYKAQESKDFWKVSKPCNVGILNIGKPSLSTLRWVPMCQGFSNFSGFLAHFVLTKIASTSIRVKVVNQYVSPVQTRSDNFKQKSSYQVILLKYSTELEIWSHSTQNGQ